MIRIVDFKTEYRPGKDPVDRVLIAPMGEDWEKIQVWKRVTKLDPESFPEHKRSGDSYALAKARWEVIQPAYESFKNGMELPESGTPIEAWSALSPDQVQILRKHDVRTVEEVEEMGLGVMENLHFPNAKKLPELARKFLSGEDSAKKDLQIAELQERLETLSAAINERGEENKPRRGRPPKVREGEDA